jgi:hypothetical protein
MFAPDEQSGLMASSVICLVARTSQTPPPIVVGGKRSQGFVFSKRWNPQRAKSQGGGVNETACTNQHRRFDIARNSD